jgi:outer membrane immunogenic protein
MKKLCATAVALIACATIEPSRAADLPAAPIVAPIYGPMFFSWTGFYVGGNLGGVLSQGGVTDSLTGFNASISHNGFVGGGQVGFNYQFLGAAILGVEATFDGTSLNTSIGPVVTNFGTFQGTANTKWLSTAAVRFGATVDHWLAYGKVGVIWAGNTVNINNAVTGASVVSASNTNNGWLVGGGVEYAFAPNWSAKLEYDFSNLSHWSSGGILVNDTLTVSRQIQTLTAGVNYKFDWAGPLVARY